MRSLYSPPVAAPLIAIVLVAACATSRRAEAPRSATASTNQAATAATDPAPTERRGLVLPPGGGERLTYCERPLELTILVDSMTAPTTHLVAGLGQLRGDEGAATHTGADEVVFIVRGSGHGVFGVDTVALRPGTVAFVPEGVSHQLVSTAAEPMTYLWVIGPRASAGAFRRAAALGCPTPSAPSNHSAAAPSTSTQVAPASPAGRRAAIFEPGTGDRIRYCLFPLEITAKVDAESAPGGRLTAAAGSLGRGAEVGTHRVSDEVVYITRGRGRAFIGTDTTAVEAGSVTFVPNGTLHGFVNDGDDPLEYFIVYGSSFSRGGFRDLATRPGPYCAPRSND